MLQHPFKTASAHACLAADDRLQAYLLWKNCPGVDWQLLVVAAPADSPSSMMNCIALSPSASAAMPGDASQNLTAHPMLPTSAAAP